MRVDLRQRLCYIFSFFKRYLILKCHSRGHKLEYIKLLKTSYSSSWHKYFFSLNIVFSCMDALLHKFETWSSNDNQLSIVITWRVTEFSDLISLLSIWSCSWIICFVDICSSINLNLSGFTIMLIFLNQFAVDSNPFFNVSSNVYLFLDASELYCHLQNYKYHNSLIPLACHYGIF